MIHIAHILPTAYLEKTSALLKEKYHLLLAHNVFKDSEYLNFYRGLKRSYIILDNSAFEFGKAISDEKLIRAIHIVEPHEFILPDVLGDGIATVQRTTSFLKAYKQKKPIRFMGVVQGETLNQWTDCYYFLSNHPRIYSIGIPVIYAKKRLFGITLSGGVSGREYLLNHLKNKKIMNAKKPIHLLGLNNACVQELSRLKKYSIIRSADTALAFVLAKKRAVNNRIINFQERYLKKLQLLLDRNIEILNTLAA